MNILTSLLKQHPFEIFCALTIAFTFSATLLPLPGEAAPVVIVFIPAFVAAGLFHASQSFFVIVNEGIPPTQLVWSMAGVSLTLFIVIVARSGFARKPVAAILLVVEAARTGQPLAPK